MKFFISRKTKSENYKGPEMLVLDGSYTLEMMVENGTLHSVFCRDLGGFFTHVWSVHPFASMFTSDKWAVRHGSPLHHKLNDTHTFIEGKVGRFKLLEKLFILNFFISQFVLFIELLILIYKNPIKIIRVGDPLYLGIFGLALSKLTGIPLVIRVNGNNEKIRASTGQPLYPRLLRSIYIEKKIEHFIFPRADLVAAPNKDNLEFSVASGAKPDSVTIFRYGNLLAPIHLADPSSRLMDVDLFTRLAISPKKYLLCIGRLQPLKYPDDSIRIMKELRVNGHEIKLVFAGEGEMLGELKKIATELDVLGHVVFAGNQNQIALAQLNTFCLAVVSPLTGRALSESALCAAPIVAYNLDWQGELIVTGKTGILCPPRNWKSMAEGVERYINDPEFAVQMGINARQSASSMLNPELLDQHERNEYSRLLNYHSKC
jgi:glycosyltransferase involved in cell wall biosynthesis